jgi:hypothetical protein
MTVSKDVLTDRYGTPDQAPPIMSQPMGANAKVYAGTVAVTRAGYVVASDSPQSTDIVWGIVSKQTDNTTGSFFGGAQGAAQCPIDRGSFWLAYTGAVTQADVDATVYLSDAVTVSKTAGSSPVAGTILAVDTSISKVAVALGVVSSGATPGNPF